MYVCEVCREQIEPHVECSMVVVKTRAKLYPPRADGTRPVGHETVKEVRACPDCAPLAAETWSG